MDLELSCEVSQFGDNVRFGYREISDGISVDVTRHVEFDVILLDDNNVERLYEYLGEYLGKDKESVPEVSTKSIEGKSELLNMSFRCTSDPINTFDTSFDEIDEDLYINVKNDDKTSEIYLSSEDALTMAKNINKAFEGVGIEAEPVVEKPSLSLDEASSELQHNFYCASDDGSHLLTGYDISDNQLTLDLTEDSITNYIYLKAEDAIKLSESITKVFGTDQNNPEPHYMRPFKAESVVDEFEAASKADLDKVATDLKEPKEDFHNDMVDVAIDLSKLNKDLNQVRVEISQIQNDIFNTNERNKVKWESLGKLSESISKEVATAMEHLATRIDENGEEIQSIKVLEDIRKMKSRSVW